MTTFELPCVIFRISRLWYPGMPEDELYDATRGWWVLGSARDKAPFAVAVAEGVVRQVYEVGEWLPRYFPDTDTTRWGFTGWPSEEHADLVGSDVSSLFKAGQQNPVAYQNLDDQPTAPASGWSTSAPPLAKARSTLTTLIKSLDENPVLVMSLHSKEVFHSNLLGWLIERDPKAGARVLAPWLIVDESCNTLRVQRERNHLDLVVELPGHQPLIIENKVFSLPLEEQLEGYAEKNIPNLGISSGSRVLLSLADPGWAQGKFQDWRWASWRELIDCAAAEFSGDAFIQELVRQWVELVRTLARLTETFAPDDLEAPVHLDGETLALLEQVGLADAMRKFRNFAFRGKIEQAFRSAGIRVDEVEAGFSNKHPLLSVKVSVADGSTIGWQLQAGQWRRFVIVPEQWQGGPASKRSSYVQEHHAAWFDFSTEQTLGPFGGAPNTSHKHFAPGFVYDYVRVPGLTGDLLLQLSVTVTQTALDYAGCFARRGAPGNR